jgi:hypothetical protein
MSIEAPLAGALVPTAKDGKVPLLLPNSLRCLRSGAFFG